MYRYLIGYKLRLVILNLFQKTLNNGLQGYSGDSDLRKHDGSGSSVILQFSMLSP